MLKLISLKVNIYDNLLNLIIKKFRIAISPAESMYA
jgi:hypothetical protein